MIDDDNGDNDDDNDWQIQLWKWNVAMEHACMSLVLIINRKHFEQAYTACIFLSSTKIPSWDHVSHKGSEAQYTISPLHLSLRWQYRILNQYGLTLIQHGWVITWIYIKCRMKLLILYQPAAVQLLKFVNGYIISSHTLLDIWLLIHTEMTVSAKGASEVR